MKSVYATARLLNLKRSIGLAAPLFFLVVAGICMPGTARADIFNVSFTAAGFGAGAPQDPVSGSFEFTAASATSAITALDSVNLTIAGHVYTLGEVGFSNGSHTLIGGTLNTPNAISSNTTDFWIRWTTASDAPLDFIYSTAGVNDFFSGSLRTFSITAVPEPASLALLLGAGPFLVPALLRRRKRTKVN